MAAPMEWPAASVLEGIGMRHSILMITLCSGAAKGTISPNNVGDISPQLWYQGFIPRITTRVLKSGVQNWLGASGTAVDNIREKVVEKLPVRDLRRKESETGSNERW